MNAKGGTYLSWKNWFGWLLVALAAMDAVLLFRRERAADGSAESSTADL